MCISPEMREELLRQTASPADRSCLLMVCEIRCDSEVDLFHNFQGIGCSKRGGAANPQVISFFLPSLLLSSTSHALICRP